MPTHYPSSVQTSRRLPPPLLAACWLLLGFFAFLCPLVDAETAPPDQDASSEDVQQNATLESADRAFNQAARARDRETVASLLGDDVTFFADVPHRGRDAFLTAWQPLWSGKYDFSYRAEQLHATVADSSDLGFAVGTVETRFQAPGTAEPSVIGGHYLNVWMNGENGWRLAASSALVVHPELGAARDPRSGLMTAWPQLADMAAAAIALEWLPSRTVEADSGELLYTLGRYRASFTRGETHLAGEGDYLAVWQRDEKGAWQLAGEGFTPPALERPRDSQD